MSTERTFKFTVTLKDCDKDFGLGAGVIADQVVTVTVEDYVSEARLQAYLSDYRKEMLDDLFHVNTEEVEE